jgi:hypothetical protein
MADSTAFTAFFDAWQDVNQKNYALWLQAVTTPQPPNLWTDWWQKSTAVATAPEPFQAAQKLWAEQLETMAQHLARIMGTEAFAALQSKWLEQQLVWQEKLTQALQPQMEVTLRTFNLPSRQHVDRLFERVIGLESRFDDVEALLRQLLLRVKELQTTAVADTSATSVQQESLAEPGESMEACV